MLYLNPPYYIINGVSLFADHEDPLQYYFLPLMPHLTQLEDPVADSLVPQIQLIKYQGAAGNGGFLNFDVNLGVDQDRLEGIRHQLQRLAELDDPPRLAPVPLIDGSVKLLLFGRESGDTPSNGNTQPQFVLKISHHAKPALFGDNQAAFSVQLEQAGVVTVEKALQGELSPIGIVYALDYLALRPAYSVRVKADWNRVQHHLHESFGTDFLIFSTQVDKIVDELIEDRVIQLEVDNYIPPGEDAADLLGRLDQAVNEVKEMVLMSFFEPSLDPIHEEKDGWDKLLHVAERASLLHATGGWGGISLFTKKKVDITRLDQKTLNVNMTERTTVKRSIYPQAHLQGLFRVLRDSNGAIDIDRFVVPVDLDDDWFQARRVDVIARANFASDDVESINVKLTYNDEPQNVILEPGHPQASVQWRSVSAAGKMLNAVKASYEVAFKNSNSSERPIRLHSPEEIISVEKYEVRPHELYQQIPVAIVALDFPWQRYPHVEVQVRYTDPAFRIDLQEVFVLDAKKTECTWQLFTMDPKRNQFSYKLIYRAADHRDQELPWVATDLEQITIRDPFPQKLRFQVVPAFNWREISLVFVDLHYSDPENQVREDFSLHFNEAESDFKTIEIPLVNPEQRFLAYQATIIYRDGRVLETPTAITLANRAIITPTMRGHQIVTVQPPITSLAEAHIAELSVTLKFDDPTAGLSFNDNFTFRSATDHPRYFEFDYADSQHKQYAYQITYFHTNGLQRSTDWLTSDQDRLVLPL